MVPGVDTYVVTLSVLVLITLSIPLAAVLACIITLFKRQQTGGTEAQNKPSGRNSLILSLLKLQLGALCVFILLGLLTFIHVIEPSRDSMYVIIAPFLVLIVAAAGNIILARSRILLFNVRFGIFFYAWQLTVLFIGLLGVLFIEGALREVPAWVSDPATAEVTMWLIIMGGIVISWLVSAISGVWWSLVDTPKTSLSYVFAFFLLASILPLLAIMIPFGNYFTTLI